MRKQRGDDCDHVRLTYLHIELRSRLVAVSQFPRGWHVLDRWQWGRRRRDGPWRHWCDPWRHWIGLWHQQGDPWRHDVNRVIPDVTGVIPDVDGVVLAMQFVSQSTHRQVAELNRNVWVTAAHVRHLTYNSRAIAGRTARCRRKFSHISNSTTASCGFFTTARLSWIRQWPFKCWN